MRTLATMRVVLTTLFSCVLPCSAKAQACDRGTLPEAAKAVATVRHGLHMETVRELDPAVPATIAAKLAQLKNALAQAAEAAMACAGPATTPEALQAKLAAALHANLPAESETEPVTASGKDLGAYGSDLNVQVLPLSNTPRYLEVDFRYNVECGDDHLLLVYKLADGRAENNADGTNWQQVLRWDATDYKEVSDAFGDFILLTLLPGSPAKPNWRFVVAHGQPGCSANDDRSRFDLDLLEPGNNPTHPQVAWHMERSYRRADTPRLGTTEDTLTFELVPPAPSPGLRNPSAPSPTIAPARQIYRYRVSSDNQVQAIGTAPEPATPSRAVPTQASTRSPQ